jgi:arabinose-5-phosphate isomerase
MGDALAVALLSCRNFSAADFAKYHPGGALGKKIYLRLEDIISAKPILEPNADLKKCIVEISESRAGAVVVCVNNKVKGIITDGDLRRMLYSGKDLDSVKASDIMSANPTTLESNLLAVEGVEVLKQRKINHIIVTEKEKYLGIIHIQDFIREGLI